MTAPKPVRLVAPHSASYPTLGLDVEAGVAYEVASDVSGQLIAQGWSKPKTNKSQED